MTAPDWSPTAARERADGIVALHGRGGDPSEETPWCDLTACEEAVRWAAKYDAREYRALAVSLMVVAIMTVMLVLEAIR